MTARSSSSIDWSYFLDRCNKLGATNDSERAKLAGVSVRTYYRLKNGEASIKLTKLDEIAGNLGVTTHQLIGMRA